MRVERHNSVIFSYLECGHSLQNNTTSHTYTHVDSLELSVFGSITTAHT